MKKFLMILTVLLISQISCFAINYDTTVVVTPMTEINADNVNVGDIVNFQTLENVIYNGDIAFPEGTIVQGKITKIKNNFIFGMPGILFAGDFEISDKNGVRTKLTGNAVNMGISRYWALVPGILFCLPFIFVKGDDGKLTPGNQYSLYIP